MKMKKIDQYRIAVTMEARQLIKTREAHNNQNIQAGSGYVMENISTRYEKTCIKRLLNETNEYIEFEIGDVELDRAKIEVLNNRMATIEANAAQMKDLLSKTY